MVDLVTIIEAAGSLFMGFFVAWVAFYFFNRDKTFNATEFGAFMAVIFGGTIIQVFTSFLTTPNQWIFWVYPIGLVFGMIIYGVVAYLLPKGVITLIPESRVEKPHKDKDAPKEPEN